MLLRSSSADASKGHEFFETISVICIGVTFISGIKIVVQMIFQFLIFHSVEPFNNLGKYLLRTFLNLSKKKIKTTSWSSCLVILQQNTAKDLFV